MSSPTETLSEVVARHGIPLPDEQMVLLARYCELVWNWNTKINLTRHTDFEKFVARDLVDSLAIAEYLAQGERVLDVGSGGGVPGVVLAIVRPDLKIALSDSVGKKARVLSDIVAQLGLHVPVHAQRAEEVLARERFDTLVVRAVARLAKLLGWFQPHWDRFDRMLILKGPAWIDERGEARHVGLFQKLALRKLKEYPLPGTDSQSVLLLVAPKEKMQGEANDAS